MFDQDIEVTYYKTVNETVYRKRLSNGLLVTILPKEGFNKAYVVFGTKFGSNDLIFKLEDEHSFHKVPMGVAHFLEHRMFSNDEVDYSKLFANYGFNDNAYTSFDRTAYLFSGTSNINKGIEILLDMVQNLKLTTEIVEKEKGIIIQELLMYQDNPDYRAYFECLNNLYINHNIRNDIGGTVESVTNTTVEDLEICHKTFYHPSNMELIVVGGVEPNTIFEVIENNQNKKEFSRAKRIIIEDADEPKEINCASSTIKMDITVPQVVIGFKINEISKDSKHRFYQNVTARILLDILFSKSSEIYETLTKKGLVNDSFSADYTQDSNYAFIMISCATEKKKELVEYLQDLFNNIMSYTLLEEDFMRVKRKLIGSYIRAYDSVNSVAELILNYNFNELDFFKVIDDINNITLLDINDAKKHFDKQYMTIVNIEPK